MELAEVVEDLKNQGYSKDKIIEVLDTYFYDEECKRPSKDAYYLGITKAVAVRSTCLKRHYGAVIVNNDEIVSTGYNGSPRGEKNCCDVGYCKRMDKPSNSGLYDECHSVHAEQNALLSASRDRMIGGTLYLWGEEYIGGEWKVISDTSPCPLCKRMIKNAGIIKVVTNDGSKIT